MRKKINAQACEREYIYHQEIFFHSFVSSELITSVLEDSRFAICT